MKKVTKSKKDSFPHPPWIVILLAYVAFFISVYLVWSSWKGTQLAGCGGAEMNCEDVITTRWGKWFGIPVSAGALLIYAGIFSISYLMRKSASRKLWLVLMFLSAVAASSALWFIGLQIFEVRSYCMYCMAVHACGLLIAIIVLKKIPVGLLGIKSIASAIIAGMIGVVILAAGQLYGIRSSANQTLTEPVQSEIVKEPSVELLHQEITLADGKLQFSLDNLPIVGSKDALNFVAHFFDYTCPACRKFHATLKSTQQTYESQTSLIMIPVPLDAACNPAIRETAYIHQNACAFAKIGLTIWRIAPQSYEAYDEFMFKDQFPPSLSAAEEIAAHLAGKEAIDRALVDPEVMNDLSKGIRMFYSPAFQEKALPALVTKSQVITGFPSPDLLTKIFSE
ncbi:MAG TPA: vitamin K epoxide reductase family protein [Acidobacteriota bacterium]|nr:vitamin K epoxide reductase family protein [Acidobacteriota bacterium]